MSLDLDLFTGPLLAWNVLGPGQQIQSRSLLSFLSTKGGKGQRCPIIDDMSLMSPKPTTSWLDLALKRFCHSLIRTDYVLEVCW